MSSMSIQLDSAGEIGARGAGEDVVFFGQTTSYPRSDSEPAIPAPPDQSEVASEAKDASTRAALLQTLHQSSTFEKQLESRNVLCGNY